MVVDFMNSRGDRAQVAAFPIDWHRRENIGEIIFQSSIKIRPPPPARNGIWPQKGAKGTKNRAVRILVFFTLFAARSARGLAQSRCIETDSGGLGIVLVLVLGGERRCVCFPSPSLPRLRDPPGSARLFPRPPPAPPPKGSEDEDENEDEDDSLHSPANQCAHIHIVRRHRHSSFSPLCISHRQPSPGRLADFVIPSS